MKRGYFGNKSRLTRLFAGSFACLLIFVWSFHKLTTESLTKRPQQTNQRYLVRLNELPRFTYFGSGRVTTEVKGFDKIVAEDNGQVEDMFAANDGENGRWVVVTGDQKLETDLLLDSEDVADVEADQVVTLVDDSSDYSFQELLQYARLSNAEKDKTWGIRVSKTAEGLSVLKPTRQVLVGVVDTGCDLTHPALKDNLVKGHNFAGGDANDPSNRNSDEMHATHVSGTIVAKNNGDGFYGIAQSVAKVMNVRVLDETGSGTLINVARGIEYAADQGVNVINMSLGAPSYSRALHDSVKYAYNKGVTIVCAKGNSNTDRAFYPAEFPEVIRVTATALKKDGTEERAYFSNYGKSSTCAAPGHITYSTLPGGQYGFASGTSMACPHAAACAAVILSQGKFTPDEVKAIMETRGDELKTDQPVGKRINLLKFVQKAAHDQMPLINNHPYGQCCIDAGIVSRNSFTSDDNGRLTETVDQDSEGSISTYYDTNGTTEIFGKNGDYQLMKYTPKSTSEAKEIFTPTVNPEPVSSTYTVSDWCWKCADFHEANKVCSGVREQPAAAALTPDDFGITVAAQPLH